MLQKVPSIACIGVMGRHNNPLHIATFPISDDTRPRNKLEYSFMLSSCLDIFEARMPLKPVGQDFGLLQAIDERLAMYGWLTNTGVKFVIILDMEGRTLDAEAATRGRVPVGIRNSDLTRAFHDIQAAYISLLRNPFYMPDEHSPHHPEARRNATALQISSKKFIHEIDRVGNSWSLPLQAR